MTTQHFLDRLHQRLNVRDKPLVERLRLLIRAEQKEINSDWVNIVQMIPIGVSTSLSAEMFTIARSKLYAQAIEQGFSEIEARGKAVEWLMKSNVY